MKRIGYILLAIFLPLLVVGYELFYKVDETEQVIVTQFSKPVGGIIDEAGLKLKIPFVQTVNRIEKRILLWDGSANDMPTKDKLHITVDTFGQWKIKDPLQYFLRLRNERSAQSRLDDILGSETRNAVVNHQLIEIVRTTKDRKPIIDPLLAKAGIGNLLPIKQGRRQIEEDIFAAAAVKLSEFGIELLDIRFKRINYNESVRQKIYARMLSERQQIAERFRSEVAGEAAKIIGKKDKDLQWIESKAHKEIQTIKGIADAKAADIYSTIYDRSKDSRALYGFVKTLETYQKVIDPTTTLVITTDSELYQLLDGIGE